MAKFDTTQHTPGPWYVDDTAESSHLAACLIENPSWVAIEDTADDGGHLAYTHPDNANLIAAAPDLLEATRKLIRAAETGDADLAMEAHEELRAAYRKAEGR